MSKPLSPAGPSEKKRKPLLAPLPVDTRPFGSRPHTPYLGLPAKYSGIPNFLHYRIGAGADLQGAALSQADLRWSNFQGANLKGARFEGSILWGSMMAQADLTGADLRQADLTGVDLCAANLTDAQVEGAAFTGARYNQITRFPRGFGNPEAKGMISVEQAVRIC